MVFSCWITVFGRPAFEVQGRIELPMIGFADRCLATWLLDRLRERGELNSWSRFRTHQFSKLACKTDMHIAPNTIQLRQQ
jgi:hypothetical protein